MKERFRVERCPSWMEEELSSSKALRRKKKSLWSWAPIRAIAKIRQQQFFCVFSIFVQTIDGLPATLDGLRLLVQLERKSKLWQTMPSRVFQRIAEFDETLHIETTIFGRETNIQDRTMKFMPKDYILSVVAIDVAEHFPFNQHRFDLSRLLPASVEGFWEPDKPMSSTASFKLGGKAEGAVLVATFDFEVLNEEFRQSNLSIDGNASARFRESSLRRVSRAVKSLPNSPNPSPFVRCSDYHFTSPCTSDHDYTDSIYIEKFDLDSSVKETEECSVYDYSSSDEERYQALRNDPLSLDAFAEIESVALSPAVRSHEGLGSLDDFSIQLHLANTDCVEKVKSPPTRRTKSDTLCDQIDVRRLLDAQEPEKEGSKAFLSSQDNVTFFSHKDVEVLERNFPNGELAADKFCINVEIADSCPTANIARVGSNDMISSSERVEGQCFIGGIMLSPTFVRPKSLDIDGEALTLEEGEMFFEVNEKHMLVEGAQSPSPEAFGSPTVHCQDKSEVCMELQAQSNAGVSPQHSYESVEFECGLAESSEVLTVCVNEISLTVLERNEDVELDIFQFSAEDEDLSLEANVVAEDFFDLLERDAESTCTRPCSPMAVVQGETFEQAPFSEECWLSSTGEFYATNKPFQDAQEERPFLTPVRAGDFSATTYPSQDRQDMEGAFACAKHVGEIPEDDVLDRDFEDGLGLLSIIEAAESEMKKAAQTLLSKERAKMLEDAETKALMKEWGLTDRVFERSPPNLVPCSTSEVPHTSDSISVITLKDGGSLRAMSLDRFQPCSSLVMQVSRPVVIPARTSSCAVDILGSMASQGLENMTVQAFLRMPLEDLVGLSVEQFAAEDGRLDGCNSSARSWKGSYRGHTVKESSEGMNGSGTDCTEFKPLQLQPLAEEVVSFGDLTHVALKRIEPLAIEGLKVQCNLAQEVPNVSVKSLVVQKNKIDQVPTDAVQEFSHLKDGRHTHLSSAKSLLDMTVSLDEWLQLCEGVNEAGSEIPDSKLYLETLQKEECSKADDIPECLRWPSFNNNLTVVMLLQLRDPQRYYEPVGASMMALVQAERVNHPRLRSSPLENGKDIANSIQRKGGMDQLHEIKSGVQLKITGVHVSGVYLPDENTSKLWGNKQQLQSGSRWVVANSKAYNSRHVVSQSSSHVEANTKLGKREILWSISACVHNTGTTWREPEEFFPLIRNPDLAFTADDTVRNE